MVYMSLCHPQASSCVPHGRLRFTPLHAAASAGCERVVHLLCEAQSPQILMILLGRQVPTRTRSLESLAAPVADDLLKPLDAESLG